ncbi:MAG: hypothetical protein KGI69_01725 [Patescibacteria group bacterium]|nr:hypothetical protein [Patescibacteria group bacterium]
MTKTIARTYDTAFENRSRITAILLSACLFMALFYAYDVYSVVSKTVALEKVSRQTTAVSGAISALDGSYIALLGSVTPDALGAYGLEAGQVAAYIPLSAPTASLGGLASAGHEL